MGSFRLTSVPGRESARPTNSRGSGAFLTCTPRTDCSGNGYRSGRPCPWRRNALPSSCLPLLSPGLPGSFPVNPSSIRSQDGPSCRHRISASFRNPVGSRAISMRSVHREVQGPIAHPSGDHHEKPDLAGDRVGPLALPLGPELVRQFAAATLDDNVQFQDGRIVPPCLVATQIYRARRPALVPGLGRVELRHRTDAGGRRRVDEHPTRIVRRGPRARARCARPIRTAASSARRRSGPTGSPADGRGRGRPPPS